MFSFLFLTVNVHHQEPQQVMDLILLLLALYMNDTTQKTPCQSQSVHCLGGRLIAENVTIPQLRDFRLLMWCK